MAKRKTIKFTLDNKVIFRLEIQGSDEIVEKLIADTWFNSALRDAAQELIKTNLQKNTLQVKPPKLGIV